MQLNKIVNVKMWDLDGTVIDSFHRVKPCLKPNGDLDLEKYKREACKHELIQQDRLLPLVELMRKSFNDASTINYIVTARLLSKSDYYYLRKQGLRGRDSNVQVLSRDTLHKHVPMASVKDVYHSGDANYKAAYFDMLLARHGTSGITYTMYDDHQGVLSKAREYGFNAVDATELNDMLSIGIKLASEQFLDETISDDLDIDYLNDRVMFAWQQLSEEEKVYYSVKYPHLANVA